jgi:hypothetical protein
MLRYGLAIRVRHPRTGTYHAAAVNQGFQPANEGGCGVPGELIPREAYARTLCQMTDPGFRYAETPLPEGARMCGHCS